MYFNNVNLITIHTLYTFYYKAEINVFIAIPASMAISWQDQWISKPAPSSNAVVMKPTIVFKK